MSSEIEQVEALLRDAVRLRQARVLLMKAATDLRIYRMTSVAHPEGLGVLLKRIDQFIDSTTPVVHDSRASEGI